MAWYEITVYMTVVDGRAGIAGKTDVLWKPKNAALSSYSCAMQYCFTDAESDCFEWETLSELSLINSALTKNDQLFWSDSPWTDAGQLDEYCYSTQAFFFLMIGMTGFKSKLFYSCGQASPSSGVISVSLCTTTLVTDMSGCCSLASLIA